MRRRLYEAAQAVAEVVEGAAHRAQLWLAQRATEHPAPLNLAERVAALEEDRAEDARLQEALLNAVEALREVARPEGKVRLVSTEPTPPADSAAYTRQYDALTIAWRKAGAS